MVRQAHRKEQKSSKVVAQNQIYYWKPNHSRSLNAKQSKRRVTLWFKKIFYDSTKLLDADIIYAESKEKISPRRYTEVTRRKPMSTYFLILNHFQIAKFSNTLLCIHILLYNTGYKIIRFAVPGKMRAFLVILQCNMFSFQRKQLFGYSFIAH